jgi:hypothetical protein
MKYDVLIALIYRSKFMIARLMSMSASAQMLLFGIAELRGTILA